MYKVSILNEDSGYNELCKHYENNKYKEWDEWLEVKTVFPRPGRQGLVGILQSKKDPDINYIFKLSQYLNYLVQHEMSVLTSLNDLGSYCPHFCKGIGGTLAKVDPNSRKDGNPFEISTKYPVEKEVLLLENLTNTTKFYNYIRSPNICDNILYSSIKQTLLAIAIAQKKKKFTHYDLHSNNIMMKKCNPNIVFLYVLDEQNQYCVPTHGHYPVIIDFGFSYSSNMDGNHLWPSLGHTHVGFMSDRFDKFADPKLFLVTVSGEIKEKRNNNKSKKLRNIVKNMFTPLNIDWTTGWDNGGKKGASDYVTQMLKGYNNESELFDKYDHHCVDLLQSLIVLPLQEQKYSNIDKSYQTFLTEFVKIEKQIGNPFYSLYILKGIVDISRDVHADYTRTESRSNAVKHFKQAVYQYIDCVSKYCRPKDVHFEKMLCGVLCLSKNIEGVLYDVIYTQMKTKEKEYNKLPLQTIEQMYAVLELNIRDTYKFNDLTTIVVLNCLGEKCEEIKLNKEEQQTINETDTISRGTVLYNIYNYKK
jgi:hypothetical protein